MPDTLSLPRTLVNRLLTAVQQGDGTAGGRVTRDADGNWHLEAAGGEARAGRETVAWWTLQPDAEIPSGLPCLVISLDTRGVLQIAARRNGEDVPVQVSDD